MSAHTAGPWSLNTVPTTVGSCHKIGPFPRGLSGETWACVYADGCRIGVDDNTPNAVELHANARLIAAAPELLAALKALVSEKCEDTGDGWAELTARIDDVEQARAAIASATGEKA